jgi:hypothetical protein
VEYFFYPQNDIQIDKYIKYNHLFNFATSLKT